ncbi:hypothetical protein FA15DRAFT_203640 [Coprinopsis marcescibilis]|uniref:Uncharacterized protein n=1 Tax=Coprinopsis marcescibilis TaxID=230819 RepID=A0A5C3LC75_COPMA|nr:hypothetical protein FA15DRAFT_203640 [Coprinopsis marcescibilis]
MLASRSCSISPSVSPSPSIEASASPSASASASGSGSSSPFEFEGIPLDCESDSSPSSSSSACCKLSNKASIRLTGSRKQKDQKHISPVPYIQILPFNQASSAKRQTLFRWDKERGKGIRTRFSSSVSSSLRSSISRWRSRT